MQYIPRDWALYSDSQYDSRNFPYPRFCSDIMLSWVEAMSLISGSSKLVPASMVFLPYHTSANEFAVCPSISTGLSCRATRTEAILYGIYECIERDAFTIYWLNCIRAPKITIDQIEGDVKDVFYKHFARPGIKYHIFGYHTKYCNTDIFRCSYRGI